MSNISDLKDLLVTTAGTITVTAERLRCLAAIDTWYAAKTAADAVASSSLQAYSMGNRSVTKKADNSASKTEQNLFNALLDWPEIAALFATRGSGLADMRGSESVEARSM